METLNIIVPEDDSGERLDSFLHGMLEDRGLSRSQIQRLIKDKQILVNASHQKAGFRLKGNENLQVNIPDPEPLDIEPEPLPLSVIYEDSSILVINKVVGMSVHPGAGCDSGTLVNALLYYTHDLSGINGVLRPGIIHRLDKSTSGVMIVAKNDLAHIRLSRQFQKKVVRKEYLAIIHDHIVPPVGRLDYPIGRDRHNRKKMTVVTSGGREAISDYSVEEQFEHFDLVRVFPLHGRTHQIRVHLSHIGHPVLADKLYGKKVRKQASSPELDKAINAMLGNALHAHRIHFLHPETKEEVTFEAELPQHFTDLLTILRG